jgi:hypothetical protein
MVTDPAGAKRDMPGFWAAMHAYSKVDPQFKARGIEIAPALIPFAVVASGAYGANQGRGEPDAVR